MKKKKKDIHNDPDRPGSSPPFLYRNKEVVPTTAKVATTTTTDRETTATTTTTSGDAPFSYSFSFASSSTLWWCQSPPPFLPEQYQKVKATTTARTTTTPSSWCGGRSEESSLLSRLPSPSDIDGLQEENNNTFTAGETESPALSHPDTVVMTQDLDSMIEQPVTHTMETTKTIANGCWSSFTATSDAAAAAAVMTTVPSTTAPLDDATSSMDSTRWLQVLQQQLSTAVPWDEEGTLCTRTAIPTSSNNNKNINKDRDGDDARSTLIIKDGGPKNHDAGKQVVTGETLIPTTAPSQPRPRVVLGGRSRAYMAKDNTVLAVLPHHHHHDPPDKMDKVHECHVVHWKDEAIKQAREHAEKGDTSIMGSSLGGLQSTISQDHSNTNTLVSVSSLDGSVDGVYRGPCNQETYNGVTRLGRINTDNTKTSKETKKNKKKTISSTMANQTRLAAESTSTSSSPRTMLRSFESLLRCTSKKSPAAAAAVMEVEEGGHSNHRHATDHDLYRSVLVASAETHESDEETDDEPDDDDMDTTKCHHESSQDAPHSINRINCCGNQTISLISQDQESMDQDMSTPSSSPTSILQAWTQWFRGGAESKWPPSQSYTPTMTNNEHPPPLSRASSVSSSRSQRQDLSPSPSPPTRPASSSRSMTEADGHRKGINHKREKHMEVDPILEANDDDADSAVLSYTSFTSFRKDRSMKICCHVPDAAELVGINSIGDDEYPDDEAFSEFMLEEEAGNCHGMLMLDHSRCYCPTETTTPTTEILNTRSTSISKKKGAKH
jgi:hypothetical protein